MLPDQIKIIISCIIVASLACSASADPSPKGSCVYSAAYTDAQESSPANVFPVFCESGKTEDECVCNSLFGGAEKCVISFKEKKECPDFGFHEQCENGYYVEDQKRDCGEVIIQ